ncbi:MAG: D-glycero-beta-D-manno-heptose-7-phosphate kinase [Melioribacteraceae bacterium]|nr:D-glycero-beta-D-manno-heptose-7-phosphate kinase [Melioribacteraceae bacterium]
MNRDRIQELKNNFKNKKIAIIGDLMLDGYFWGDVSRVSPEAPVPVVEIDDEFFRFGGAANVALNILKLGGIPIPFGVIGNDHDGQILLNLMKEVGISSFGILIDETRPTTNKTRVIAGTQHVVRIDKESKENINSMLQSKIISLLKENISELDAIILQDYNKGVLTEELISSVISIGNENNKIVSVDPKFINFLKFQNTTVFKPNKKESEDILGMRIITDEDITIAGEKLLELLNPKYLMLTLGSKGLALFQKDKKEIRIPTKARKVADVSGAGDTVISTLTYALTAGASIEEAAYIANYAGGLVCEEVGIVPIDSEKLFTVLNGDL